MGAYATSAPSGSALDIIFIHCEYVQNQATMSWMQSNDTPAYEQIILHDNVVIQNKKEHGGGLETLGMFWKKILSSTLKSLINICCGIMSRIKLD